MVEFGRVLVCLCEFVALCVEENHIGRRDSSGVVEESLDFT